MCLCFLIPGSRLSSFNGDLVVRVPSRFLDSALFDPPSVCLWIASGQRHEAVESCGYLWQTCLCQTGVFRSTSRITVGQVRLFNSETCNKDSIICICLPFPVKLLWSDRAPVSSAERRALRAAPGAVGGRQDHRRGLQAVGCSSWIRTGLQIIHVSKHIQAGRQMLKDSHTNSKSYYLKNITKCCPHHSSFHMWCLFFFSCLLSPSCHYAPSENCIQAWRSPCSQFPASWTPQILYCPCSSSGFRLSFLCSPRSPTQRAATRSCRPAWSGMDQGWSFSFYKMKKKPRFPSFHLCIICQFTGRRVPPASSRVLGSRHRAAAFTVGAFERFCEES